MQELLEFLFCWSMEQSYFSMDFKKQEIGYKKSDDLLLGKLLLSLSMLMVALLTILQLVLITRGIILRLRLGSFLLMSHFLHSM